MNDPSSGEEEMTTWLYDRYVEKEELLKNFKENGNCHLFKVT